MSKEKTTIKRIAENRAARHEYFIIESFEAGIELYGTEVKSIRAGGINLKESWIAIESGQMYARHVHISPYEKGNIFNRDPMRDKRLLMHRREIRKLYDSVRREGLTLIPLSVYFKGSRVKMQVGLCKGKKLHDKRETIARREVDRNLDRVMKSRGRSGD